MYILEDNWKISCVTSLLHPYGNWEFSGIGLDCRCLLLLFPSLPSQGSVRMTCMQRLKKQHKLPAQFLRLSAKGSNTRSQNTVMIAVKRKQLSHYHLLSVANTRGSELFGFFVFFSVGFGVFVGEGSENKNNNNKILIWFENEQAERTPPQLPLICVGSLCKARGNHWLVHY